MKSESQINLPKITLKVYDGSLLNWSSFWGQFDAAVHKNNELSEIQMFTYLKSFLTAEAEHAISGLTLVKENYKNAVDIVKKRFGNKQSRISAHMKELRVLKGVENINVTGLRTMYDSLDFNINNLKELDVDVSTYGTLLIAIIFDCIPEELRIKISLTFGSEDWNLDGTMDVFKSELEACERSMVISGKPLSDCETNYFSTQSLINTAKERSSECNFVNRFNKGYLNNKTKVVRCVFCNEKHLSSRCRNVTDINVRYNIVKRDNCCFVCFKTGHRSKDCRLNYSCLKCNKKHSIALFQQQNDDQIKTNNKFNGGKEKFLIRRACGG